MFLAGSMRAELWCCVLEDDTVRAAELADLVEAVMPYPRLSDGLHGFVAMRGGDRERAAARFDAAWVDGLASLGRDWSYPGTLHLLAELAADLGRVDEARELDAALEPYDGQLLLTICNFVPASVAFVRGRLARAIGDDALARERLRQALAFEDGIGAEALARRTRAELAALDAVR
jgi:tetratricopeptide (TPR) repeat protein